MRSSVAYISSILLILLLASSCVEDYPFDGKPSITLMVSGPDTVQEFTDSVYFKIAYEDGDGDLGENDTDDHNLFVTDNRNGIQYKYRIRELVPGGASVPIRGQLSFSIKNTFIIGSSPTEVVTYNIELQDRAGNASNVLTSAPILIVQ